MTLIGLADQICRETVNLLFQGSADEPFSGVNIIDAEKAFRQLLNSPEVTKLVDDTGRKLAARAKKEKAGAK